MRDLRVVRQGPPGVPSGSNTAVCRRVTPSWRPRFWLSSELVSTGRWGDLSHAGKAVYVVLAFHSNKAGIAWPAIKMISAEAGLGRTMVIKGVGELENAGLVARLTRGGGRGSTRYRLLAPQGDVQTEAGAVDPCAPAEGRGSENRRPPVRCAGLETEGTESGTSEQQQVESVAVPSSSTADDLKPRSPKPSSHRNAESVRLLVQAGVSPASARSIALDVAGNLPLVKRQVRNLKHARLRGNIRNPEGWLRTAIREDYALPPELAEVDGNTPEPCGERPDSVPRGYEARGEGVEETPEEAAREWASKELERLEQEDNDEYRKLCNEAMREIPDCIQDIVRRKGPKETAMWRGMMVDLLIRRHLAE